MVQNFLTKKGFDQQQAEILSSAFNKHEFIEEGEYFLNEGQICKRIAIITSGMCRYFYRTDKEEVTRWVSLEGD